MSIGDDTLLPKIIPAVVECVWLECVWRGVVPLLPQLLSPLPLPLPLLQAWGGKALGRVGRVVQRHSRKLRGSHGWLAVGNGDNAWGISDKQAASIMGHINC